MFRTSRSRFLKSMHRRDRNSISSPADVGSGSPLGKKCRPVRKSLAPEKKPDRLETKRPHIRRTRPMHTLLRLALPIVFGLGLVSGPDKTQAQAFPERSIR